MKIKTAVSIIIGCLTLLHSSSQAQTATVKGIVSHEGKFVEYATVALQGESLGTLTDTTGSYTITDISAGNYKIVVTGLGYDAQEKTVVLKANETVVVDFELTSDASNLEEVVISGTMKEVSKLESPVPVEVYTSKFFKSNPNPSIFEALQNINGVRPQINCNVCNTGDIHINGLEGPYTMVMIDGMPIVSGLSSVYGLSGIPQSLIERVEIVKGPASTLYGSEAVGGLINIITKKTNNAALFSADVYGTSWKEINADIAGKIHAGDKAQSLIGINYFNYANPIDNNADGFTDVTLQNRISVFNKWNINRKNNKIFSFAGRYVYEDRWGGDMNWNKTYRGGDVLYGESIYTSRWELFGTYQLPVKEQVIFQFSGNGHDQNSVYGTTSFLAKQYIGFGQMTWNKKIKNNDVLLGATFRYTYYDDNTPATSAIDVNGQSFSKPLNTYLPGIFIQDEIKINEDNKLLLGVRYDYNSIHGKILTPRLNYKWSSKNKNNVMRMSIGNGYRVANIFTEDHAALTGSRKIEFINDLKPETSWNANVNFVKKMYADNGSVVSLDATAFYTYFTNKIIANYDIDPNKIIYNNLSGHAISKGLSLNMDVVLGYNLKIIVGGTYMDVYSVENENRISQLFTEKFTAVWSASYTIPKTGITIDYTGNLYSPMRLPLLSDTDPRREYSPWWSIQNIQLTKKIDKSMEVYIGVKNLLNWTPNRGNPFIIARTNDPFDKNVQFDANGQAMVTADNPYGLTFDPTYVYGPNQGIRAFLGFRYSLK